MRRREREWQAEQEERRRRERERQLKAHQAEQERAARAAAAERQEQQQEAEIQAFLDMSDTSISLLKQHKRSFCIASLLEMGFDGSTAEAAANAAGSDASKAVAMLMEGAVCRGTKPVHVTGEAQELLAFAASLGFDREHVELQIVMCGGDWDAVKEALQRDRFGAAAVEEAAAVAAAERSGGSLAPSGAGSVAASVAGSVVSGADGFGAAAAGGEEDGLWPGSAAATAASLADAFAAPAAGEQVFDGWSFDARAQTPGAHSQHSLFSAAPLAAEPVASVVDWATMPSRQSSAASAGWLQSPAATPARAAPSPVPLGGVPAAQPFGAARPVGVGVAGALGAQADGPLPWGQVQAAPPLAVWDAVPMQHQDGTGKKGLESEEQELSHLLAILGVGAE